MKGMDMEKKLVNWMRAHDQGRFWDHWAQNFYADASPDVRRICSSIARGFSQAERMWRVQ